MKRLHEANLSEPDRAAVVAAAGLLRRLFPFVRGVALFGSRARSGAAADSDLDLLVVTDRAISRTERHTITGALSELGREIGAVFSSLVVDEESWSRGAYRVLPIYREIEREGIAA